MINSKRCLWFIGPHGTQKTETAKFFVEEAKLIKHTALYRDLETQQNLEPTTQIGERVSYYRFIPVITDDLITVCDGSLVKTLVDIEINPYSEETREIEQQKLFEYECYLIPNSIIPTHIVLFTNPSYNKTEVGWRNYKRELEAYDRVLKKQFVKEAFSSHKTKLVKINENKLEDRVKVLYDLIK